MRSVFILWHAHKLDVEEDAKLIGVYATQADAEAAIQRIRGAPGFVNDLSGFSIDEYEVGKDHWTDGFVTM